MSFISKSFTAVTATCVGLLFWYLTFISARATYSHATMDTGKSGAFTLGTAFVLFIAALFFTLPTARRKLISATFPAVSRIFFVSVLLALFAIVFVLLSSIPENGGWHFFYGVPKDTVLAGFCILVLAFLLVFLLPGTAYSEHRAVYRELREELSHAQSHAVYDYESDQGAQTDERSFLRKVLAIVLGLAATSVLGLAYYGFSYAHFISSAAHVDLVKANSTILIGGFFIALSGSLLLGKKGKPRGVFRNPTVRAIAIILCCLPVSFLVIPAAQSGLPAVLSLNEDGRYDKIEVSVVERGRESSRRRCDRQVKVVWEIHNRTLCEVPEHVWSRLNAGDRLVLQGFLTDHGFRYETVDFVRE